MDMVDLTIAAARVQELSAGVPYHTWAFPDGRLWTTFYRAPCGFLLRFPGLADFEISADGHHVTCVPAPDVSQASAEQLYLNQVLPLALSKLGKLVFHASSVERGEGAIAFVGESGRGKSTITADFAVNGYRFLSDDGLVMEPCEQGYLVLPNHPSIRLRKDSYESVLAPDAEKASPMDYTLKARVLAGTKLRHCEQPRPLRLAYFLGDGNVAEITFRRLSAAEALLEWTKHSFLIDVEDGVLIGSHFDRIATLSNCLPCYYLDYPRRYKDLRSVLEAVVEHAAKYSSTS